jgi:hypothetical protein
MRDEVHFVWGRTFFAISAPMGEHRTARRRTGRLPIGLRGDGVMIRTTNNTNKTNQDE